MINNINLNSIFDNKNFFVYKAQRGDTIKSIAERFHTTKEVIVQLNGLTSEICVGQFLAVEKIEGEEYYVKPKDTFESIAFNSGKNPIELMIKNKTDFLYVGQKIYL